MHSTTEFEQEKHEYQSVLASGIFHRAPNLAQVLTYVCERYFEGAAEQIKEYNIAVEALGRPAVFDQKRDSIVRVEAHRLRKRLREYYEADGADHLIRIEIPPGQYAPVFRPQLPPQQSLSQETLVAPPVIDRALLKQNGNSEALAEAHPEILPQAHSEVLMVAPLALPAPAAAKPKISMYVIVLAAVSLVVSTSAIALYASRKTPKPPVSLPASVSPSGS